MTGDGRAGPAVRVGIVDDDEALCELISDRINDEFGDESARTASRREAAVALMRDHRPHVVLLDISLGPGATWFLVAELLLAEWAQSRIVVWTKWSDPSVRREEEVKRKLLAAKFGVYDWVPKSDGTEVLISRIRSAVASLSVDPSGSSPPSPIEAWLAESGARDDGAGDDGLTPAERRIASFAPKAFEADMTVSQVAKILGVKTGTLQAQLKSIYSKWNVHSQTAFVSAARDRRYIS